MEEKKLVQNTEGEIAARQGERVEQMAPFLLKWFREQARVLPWRTEPKPYYVWVSEIMLQQTRVEAVKPYFSRFIETLPDIRSLAECEEELLLKLWEGLGYYNRVRNLQKAAQVVVELYQGELPADYTALLQLPGIGSYTAGAIASIAYQIPVPAVDGNVLRVMARLMESYEDITKASVKKQTEELLKAHMPKEDAGAFNQAMMEIGAMVCLPNGQPKCTECPIRKFCLALERQVVMELPVKTKKKARRMEEMTVFVIRLAEREEMGKRERERWMQEKVVLRRRSDSGLLAGMYEFPNVPEKLELEAARKILEGWGIKIQSILPIEEAKHIFSHVEWHMKGYLVEAAADWESEDSREVKQQIEELEPSLGMIAESGTFQVKREENRLEWFAVERVQREIAIPSAFAAYTKYMEKIREEYEF